MCVVEVSPPRDRLQGLHHCFFGLSVSHCLNVNDSFVLSQQGQAWQTSCEVLPCAVCSAVIARISLCNTLKIAQPDDRSAPRRYGNILSSMVKQISCASCRSAVPCRDRSAGCPKTFFTSSVSNSGVITLAHVLRLIVNQSCHAFAGGQPRDPVGAGTLDSRRIRLTISSQHFQKEFC